MKRLLIESLGQNTFAGCDNLKLLLKNGVEVKLDDLIND